MWDGKSISVILPTYNEKDSIRQCILNFFGTGVVDEIIVVNNNAAAGTSEEVQGTGAREVFEERQGYGAAIRRGFMEAKGDYLVVCEPDGTFIEEDIFKLLAYATDHEIVFGSRTVREFVWGGANMGAFLRWGNYAVAKLMEVLFNTNSLSDVGCTFRLISRSALDKMQPYFRVYDNYFGPEMMLLSPRLDISFVQIPLNYRSRVGQSSVTGNPIKAILLGLQMIVMILMHRMEGSLLLSMPQKEKNVGAIFLTYQYYIFCFALFALCSLWMTKPLTEYLTGDSSLFLLLTNYVLGLSDKHVIDLASGRDIWHPFLYQSILIITGKIFGAELFRLRLIGIVCLLVDLYLIRKIANLLVNNQRHGRVLTFLSWLFFLIMPLTIDGAPHIDIDNTIMLPLLLLFFYFFILQEQTDNIRAKYRALFILICIVMPLLLWSKLTTSLALPAAIGIYYIFKKRLLRAVIFPASLLAVSGSIFTLTWFLFCRFFDLPFLWVFERYFSLTSSAANISMSSGYLYHLRQIAIIIFWFNITIVLLWLGCMAVLIQNYIKKENIPGPILFASIFSVIVGVTYLFIGGISFGLAKYHYPLTAFIAITIAYYTYPYFDKLTVKKAALFLLATILVSIGYFYVEDPLYLLTRGLKLQGILNLPYDPIIERLLIIFLLYLTPCLISIYLAAKSKYRLALGVIVMLAVAQMIGFNFHKFHAGYHTSHGYGYYGASDAYQKISKMNSVIFSEGMIVAPFEPLPPYALDQSKYLNSLEQFKPYILQSRPEAVIFGAPFDMISQMKNVYMKPEFHKFMQDYYKLDIVGDYYIYFKK